LLGNIIYQNLTKAKEEDIGSKAKYIRKKINYTLSRFNFCLLENGAEFAIFRIEQLEASHIINSEMESEINFDVHMIKIENYVDNEQFKIVLCPLLEGDTVSFDEKIAMLKLRMKDGYAKGIIGAPWKMYDQFEFYLFPINIRLTKNFYKKIKSFFIPTTSLEEVKSDPIYRQKKESEAVTIKPYEKLIEKEDKMFKSILGDTKTEEENKKRKKSTSKEDKKKEKEKEKEKKDKDKDKDKDKQEEKEDDKEKSKQEEEKKIQFPNYFKYFRLNELKVKLTFSSGMDILV